MIMSLKNNGDENFDGWRSEPMYSFSEASHLAGVSASTVRNWLFGYTAGGREVQPLFETADIQGPMVSFLQLIEIVVAGQFRKVGHVTFQRVRRAYENAQKLYGIDYPFAHLRLEELGSHIVERLQSEKPGTSLQAMDEPAQRSLPGLILETVHHLDYYRDLAERWFPVGKDVPIVVDPRISSGVPTIFNRGVTIHAIRKRWKAGHRIDFIAKDFELERDDVELVLQYADKVAA